MLMKKNVYLVRRDSSRNLNDTWQHDRYANGPGGAASAGLYSPGNKNGPLYPKDLLSLIFNSSASRGATLLKINYIVYLSEETSFLLICFTHSASVARRHFDCTIFISKS